MQDESRTQGQPLVASAARRRMDFAPVRSAGRATAPLPTDRELERRKLARQEMARREAIKHQIEEQNRLKNLNQRRIEAAKQELSEYQAAEEARNRALEGERQRILEHQRQAQREAAEQMAVRRKAMELEAKKRLQAEQIRKQRALQEMQRREEASKIAASKRATLKPRQTTPFFAPSSAAGSATGSVASSAASSAADSVTRFATQNHTAPSSTVSNNTTSLRPAGDTKVSASSRIQVIASPTRKLFGRIRPAGPTRQAQSESQPNFQSSNQLNSRLESQAARPLKTLADLDDDLFEDQLESEFSSSINVRRSTQSNRAKQVIKDDSDDLEDLLMSAFDEPSEKNPVKTTAKNPVKAPEYDRLAENLANNITQNTTQNTAQKTTLRAALKISGNPSEKTSQKLDSTPDTSENNMNYILGGRSPFINTDKIIKRPLSDSTRENAARLDDQNEEELSSPVRPRKNVYEKRDHSKKSAKKTTTMIVEDRPKGIGISLAIAITLMIILGTIVGAFIYFAFFQ
jgi:hypothetical protein